MEHAAFLLLGVIAGWVLGGLCIDLGYKQRRRGQGVQVPPKVTPPLARGR